MKKSIRYPPPLAPQGQENLLLDQDLGQMVADKPPWRWWDELWSWINGSGLQDVKSLPSHPEVELWLKRLI